MKKTRKNRKGYTLVELVIVILVIAVLAAATFLGGAAVIRSSQDSRTRSDLHAFEVAAQSMLYQHPELAKPSPAAVTLAALTNVQNLMNERLSADLQFGANRLSAKKDPWDKAYDLNCLIGADAGHTSIAIVVRSYGNNATADNVFTGTGATKWNGSSLDDKGVVILYTDGDVSVQYFGFDGKDSVNNINMGLAPVGVYDLASTTIQKTATAV